MTAIWVKEAGDPSDADRMVLGIVEVMQGVDESPLKVAAGPQEMEIAKGRQKAGLPKSGR